LDADGAAVDGAVVDHGCGDVPVAKKLLEVRMS
jgi:hypothetical protein